MSENYLAAIVWRLENMSESERRSNDAGTALATIAASGRFRSAARSIRGLGQRQRTRTAEAAC